MFKLVVLSVLLASAAAAPSYIHGGAVPLAYSAVHAPAIAVPSAVSYQARTDVVSKPVVAAYAAPAAYAYAAPAVAVPSAVSYQTRTDVVSKPVVATYAAAAPAVAYQAAPVYAAYSAPTIVKSGVYGVGGHYW